MDAQALEQHYRRYAWVEHGRSLLDRACRDQYDLDAVDVGGPQLDPGTLVVSRLELELLAARGDPWALTHLHEEALRDNLGRTEL